MNIDALVSSLRLMPRDRMDAKLLALMAQQRRDTGKTVSVYEVPPDGVIFVLVHEGATPTRELLKQIIAKHANGSAS